MDSYGEFLNCILLDKLPSELRKNMARQHDDDEWTLEQLRKAIRGEIWVLEAGQLTQPQQYRQPHQQYQHHHQNANAMFNGVADGNRPPFCAFCAGEHFSNQCTKFKSVEDRLKVVMQKRLCNNCLRSGHFKNDCRSKKRCRILKVLIIQVCTTITQQTKEPHSRPKPHR